MYKLFFISLIICLVSCAQSQPQATKTHQGDDANLNVVSIVSYPDPGAVHLDKYLNKLNGKRIGLVVNAASTIGHTHLVDTLRSQGVDVRCIFVPEHGFRADADAGASIENAKDEKTGLDIYSLYGENKKPSSTQLDLVDVVLFDLQDVGVRFYTYISTLHYVMEACAESNTDLIVLDRPNPNGFYVDGPVLQEGYESFVGMHRVPIVYGMTIGEYATMIQGEGWIKKADNLAMEVVYSESYQRNTTFELPVKPSPNLPNHQSILLYPSLCLFEGTTVSVGRGTEQPFQHIGHPHAKELSYFFVPKSGPGSKYPKHENKYCFGVNLSKIAKEELIDTCLDFKYLVEMYQSCLTNGVPYFNENNFFEKLAGSDSIRNLLVSGATVGEITRSWERELASFLKVRAKYLHYPE